MYKSIYCILISVLLVSMGYRTSEKFKTGTIILKDGNIIEGLITPFDLKTTNVKIRQDLKAKDTKINVNTIDFIVIKEEKTNKLDTTYAKKTGTYVFSKLKMADDALLVSKIYESDKIKGYSSLYKSDLHIYSTTLHSSDEYFFVQKKGQEHIVYVAVDPSQGYGHNYLMRKHFKLFLSNNCPEMTEQIDTKKYKVKDFIQMLIDYTSLCN